MKSLIPIIAFFLITIPVFAIADVFTIEEEKLTILPRLIEKAIRNRKEFEYSECKLIGKPINLSGHRTNSGFVATTADACNWGAAQGSIWVVFNRASPVTVLEYGGYSVTFGKQSRNGLRNITISAATAGYSSESFWKFNGVRYVKTKEEIRIIGISTK